MISDRVRPRLPGAAGPRAATWWWLGLGFFVELALAANLFAHVATLLRTLLGLPLVLAIPGYALTALLWGRRSPGCAETILLSLGLSLALAALSGILLDWTPLGIRGGQQLLLVGLVALAAIVVVLLRDVRRLRRQPPGLASARRGPPASLRVRQLVLLGVAALLVACALAYATDNVLRPAGGFTQAWITNGSEGAPLDLGVENDEGQAETYRVELLMDGRQVREWRDVRLESGRRWSAELTVADAPRPEQAELKVYRAEVPDTVYRDVRTPLRTGR